MASIRGNVFSPDIDEFLKKCEELNSREKVAQYYNVSQTTIYKLAKKLNYGFHISDRVNAKDIEKIIEMRKEGRTLTSIGKEFGCSKTFISKVCKNANSLTQFYGRRYTLDETCFSSITNEGAYFLGLIASDGCLYHHKNDNRQDILRICLQKDDCEILEKLKIFLGTTKPVTYNSHKNNGKLCHYASLEISSNKIVSDIINLGIGFKKTYSNCIPNIDMKYMSHFIRGYFDGDGSIFRKHNNSLLSSYVISISGFYHNMHKLEDILAKFNILFEFTKDTRRRKYKFTGDVFGQLKSSNKTQIYAFLKFIYADSKDLFLSRKFEDAKEFINLLESSKDVRDRQIKLYYDYAVCTKIKDMYK